ncbi:MAG: hypothetical protein DCC71_20995 [Proteobacteria bacterium]|nr:MAG: hypothetical protein DCC71_20995 [Pseudomonadota bacterium]
MPPTADPSSCQDASGDVHGCRCDCGSLLGRLVAGGVEIKCRRCKRTHVIPLEREPLGTLHHHHPRPEVANPEPNVSRASGRGRLSCERESGQSGSR